MTAPCLVLLHSPLDTPRRWEGVAAELRRRGGRSLRAEITDDDQPPYAARYVARASLEIADAAPEPPLVLVADGAAGPLVPHVGAAQRAAHRHVSGYLLVDALLPQPGTPTREELLAAQCPGSDEQAGAERSRPREFFTDPLPMVQDWPDAPCGYLATVPSSASCARLARLRGWSVTDGTGGSDPAALARELEELAAGL